MFSIVRTCLTCFKDKTRSSVCAHLFLMKLQFSMAALGCHELMTYTTTTSHNSNTSFKMGYGTLERLLRQEAVEQELNILIVTCLYTLCTEDILGSAPNYH